MKIEIDTKAIIDKGLTPDKYTILLMYHMEESNMINKLIPNAKYREVIKKQLVSTGWLERKELSYVPSDRCKILLMGASAKNTVVSAWIDEWRDLWKGIKTPGPTGYYVTGPKEDCVKRMKKYMEQNSEHTKDVIFEATQLYLKEKKKVQYEYTKKCVKFIMDRDGSELYNYCEAVINNKRQKQSGDAPPESWGVNV